MSADFNAFADVLTHRLGVIGDLVEAHVFAHKLTYGDVFCSSRIEIDALTLQCIVETLRRDAQLWTDFQQAVRGHSYSRHWTTLVEHVFTVGSLRGKLMTIEAGSKRLSTQDRRRLADLLNCVDGEIAFCLDLADRRGLAARINASAGFPVIDGLAMRALTYLLAEFVNLWRDFRPFVESSNKSFLQNRQTA
jgi:hypothetical protein